MKHIINKIFLYLGFPFTYLASFWLKLVLKAETGEFGKKMISENIFMYLGILPVLDHYYQPLINPRKYLTKSLSEDRNLCGIDFNIKEQLNLLNKFNYNEELLLFPLDKKKENEYFFNNYMYSSGDAEYLYNIIRYYKPKRIIEIGSGFSTLMAINAIFKNKLEDTNYRCQHICIEPYESPWLEKLEVELIRERVENVNSSFFQMLESNDILFIDSSHIIKPQGDLLVEYLEILPAIKSGVLIHIHDIFTPKDYPDGWVYNSHLLWNEQYLLEAFLMYNSEFRIIGALNYLAHNNKKEFAEKCPFFAAQQGYEEIRSEPRAFWMIKK
jgi:hypothetical protein